VLGLSFNIESTTANPAKKRRERERESFLPLYKFTVKTVLAFVPGLLPSLHKVTQAQPGGENSSRAYIIAT
jgi:hypothetical protein